MGNIKIVPTKFYPDGYRMICHVNPWLNLVNSLYVEYRERVYDCMQDAVKDGLQFSNFPMNIPYKEISEEEFYKRIGWMIWKESLRILQRLFLQ